MIYVNQKQLDQVEYLIEQSSRGHHVLFENDVIRKAFRLGQADQVPLMGPAALQRAGKLHVGEKKQPAENPDSVEAIEKHIENLILQPTLISKKAYLENLSPDTFDEVVRTYFSIVENNIFEGMKFCQ